MGGPVHLLLVRDGSITAVSGTERCTPDPDALPALSSPLPLPASPDTLAGQWADAQGTFTVSASAPPDPGVGMLMSAGSWRPDRDGLVHHSYTTDCMAGHQDVPGELVWYPAQDGSLVMLHRDAHFGSVDHPRVLAPAAP